MKLPLVVRLAALAVPLLCHAQAPAPIRVDVSLVNVGFSVRDEKGNLVANLTQDDFEVTEDGVPQKISFFARSADAPLTLGLIMDVSGSQQSFLKPHHNDLETGGADFDGQGKGLLDGFRQIGEQLRSSFELAYHTSNPPGDKTFHKIAIKPKQPGLTVRAKTGYYAREPPRRRYTTSNIRHFR